MRNHTLLAVAMGLAAQTQLLLKKKCFQKFHIFIFTGETGKEKYGDNVIFHFLVFSPSVGHIWD